MVVTKQRMGIMALLAVSHWFVGFAWLPVKLNDGRWVWLTKVRYRYLLSCDAEEIEYAAL